jgi:4-diphosphocytidyl-2-C-methyl-D-erythritol kinase
MKPIMLGCLHEPIQFLCRSCFFSPLLNKDSMTDRIRDKSNGGVTVFAPAKINLFLAVTSKRTDGYHELITVLAKLGIGDLVRIEKNTLLKEPSLSCPGFKELENRENLVLVAVEKWLDRVGGDRGYQIELRKTIPPMSGLGGGSSDAVSALLAMNELSDNQLSNSELKELAAEIGSDCPSFLDEGICLAEGRGEVINPIIASVTDDLFGHEIFLFRPSMGLSTKEIYRELSQNSTFSSLKWSKQRVDSWSAGKLPTEEFLHNDLKIPVFQKYLFFQPLFDQIEKAFGLKALLSGSGSCCFAWLPKNFDRLDKLKEMIELAWGDEAWVQKTHLIR